MSDAPKGEGWWQASDLRWYPPGDAGGSGDGDDASGGGSGRRGWVLPAVLVVVVALIAAGVTFVVAGGGDEAAAETVALEPVESVGADPFTESVAVNEVTEFPETVSAVIDDTVGELASDEVTGTLVAAGGTPGLYGGTRDDSACDVAALDAFLTDPGNVAKAQAWAGAAGVAVGDIATFVGELAPSVLTLDTWVTNHGFRDGRATPRQAVLQAGTAVLVDALGVPRVKCSCGNPLAEPEQLDLEAATVTGTQWASYTPGRTVVPEPAGDPQDSLTLVDVDTADTYQAPVGEDADTAAQEGLHVGVANSIEGTGPQRGAIWTSDDGEQWTKSIETGPLSGVAEHDGTIVVVGSQGGGDPDGDGGIVYTSTDASQWSQPMEVASALSDVTYFGDRWLAIGNRPTAGNAVSTTEGVIYSSPDAEDWTELTRIPGSGDGYEDGELQFDTITAGGGQLVMTGSGCLGDACFSESFTSQDALSWSLVPRTEVSVNDVAYNGEIWAMNGFTGDDYSGYTPRIGTSADGRSWETFDFSPPDAGIGGLTPGPQGWLAVGREGAAPQSRTTAIWTSPDLRSWTRATTVPDTIVDLVVLLPGS